MRPISVSGIKGTGRIRIDIPREGTITRKIYDDLVAGKTVIVRGVGSRAYSAAHSALQRLEYDYGIETRLVAKGEYIRSG